MSSVHSFNCSTTQELIPVDKYNTQYDFRSSRSCLLVLLSVFGDMIHMIDIDSSVDRVYLDFSNAFDKVDHDVVLNKLRDVGSTGKLELWLFQFQTNRIHFVRLPVVTRQDSKVSSKMPQGTILGTLLFLIMISEINKDYSSSNLISLADDTRVYTHITQISTCDNLHDLNTILLGPIVTICSLILVNLSIYHLAHQLLLIDVMLIIT